MIHEKTQDPNDLTRLIHGSKVKSEGHVQISTDAGQSILLAIAEIGRGTFLSLTVIFIVSESEQYFTPDTTMALGRQSEESSRVMSWPDFVKDLPVQVNDSMPSPPRST